jgi:hypothetical protein
VLHNCVLSTAVAAIFGTLTQIEIIWDVTPCRLAVIEVLEDHRASIFRVKQSKKMM